MRKLDGFIFIVIVLVTGLAVTYYYSNKYFNQIEVKNSLNSRYQQKLNSYFLKTTVSQIEKNEKQDNGGQNTPSGGRAIASIEASPITNLNAKELLKKVQNFCVEDKIKAECVQNIDLLVTQFPEKEETGAALVYLGQIFYQLDAAGKTKDISLVLKNYFSNKDTVDKATILERASN